METRKIIGWVLFYGYIFSTLSQLIWLVLSVTYALEHQDVVCSGDAHRKHPSLLGQQHQACTLCVDRQTRQRPPDQEGHRSQYHFRRRSVGDNSADDNLDFGGGHLELWKYPRQFVVVKDQVESTDKAAFLCSVFACHFHSLSDSPDSNAFASEKFNNNDNDHSIDTEKVNNNDNDNRPSIDSERFAAVNPKNAERSRTKAKETNVHVFDLALGDDNCSASDNFANSYGRNQCHTGDIRVFTFQVKPRFILSVDCRGILTNQSLAPEKFAEKSCIPGKAGMASFNATQIMKGDLPGERGKSLQPGQNIGGGQRLAPNLEEELEAKMSRGVSNEVKHHPPPHDHRKPLKAEVGEGDGKGVVMPTDQSNHGDLRVFGRSILMVIGRILLRGMAGDNVFGEGPDTVEEDTGHETNTSSVEWVDLGESNNKCSKDFFYPTIAVYIQGLALLLTIVCFYLSHKHSFTQDYSNHSFIVGCMICTIISGSMALITWPNACLDIFKHYWYFWADVVAVVYVMVAVLVVVFHQVYSETDDMRRERLQRQRQQRRQREGREDDDDPDSPMTVRQARPLLGQIPFYHPPYYSQSTRRTPRQNQAAATGTPSAAPPATASASTSSPGPSGDPPKTSDDQNAAGRRGADSDATTTTTTTTTSGASPIAVTPSAAPVGDSDEAGPSAPLLVGSGGSGEGGGVAGAAVPTTTYGTANLLAVNGVQDPSRSTSPTTTGSPINLMFYSNPSLASSLDDECNDFLSDCGGPEVNGVDKQEEDGRPRSDEYFETPAMDENTPLVGNSPTSRSL